MKVYVIASDGGMCKVGVAAEPEKRRAQLATGHPFPLSVFHVVTVYPGDAHAVERKAHHLLRDHRMSGEWFSVDADDAAAAVEAAAIDSVIPGDRKRYAPKKLMDGWIYTVAYNEKGEPALC